MKITKDPNIKAGLFLILCILVIALTIITLTKMVELQSTGRGKIEREKYKTSYKFNNIKNENYHFVFTKEEDGIISVYEGDRYEDKMTYTLTKNNQTVKYYKDGYTTYKSDNGKYVVVNDPIDFNSFLSGQVLKNLIGGSKCYSRTEYADNDDVTYNYYLSTVTIATFIDSETNDIDDMPNEVYATINDSNELYKIELVLDNYYKYKNNKDKSYKLTLKFSKFGKIKNIESVY